MCLEKRVVAMKTAYLKQKSQHDALSHEVELLRAGLASYGETEGKSLLLSPELQQLLEGPDEGAMNTILAESRKKYEELTLSLEDLKKRLIKLRKKEQKLQKKAGSSGGDSGAGGIEVYGRKRHMNLSSITRVVKNLIDALPAVEDTGDVRTRENVDMEAKMEPIIPPHLDSSPQDPIKEGSIARQDSISPPADLGLQHVSDTRDASVLLQIASCSIRCYPHLIVASKKGMGVAKRLSPAPYPSRNSWKMSS